MNFLFLGDIMGRSGRNIVVSKLPDLIKKHQIDFVVANGENSAGGFGITQAICNELFEVGVDVITSGNHIWDQKETMDFIREEKRLLRPWNWGEGTPGSGFEIFEKNNLKLRYKLNLVASSTSTLNPVTSSSETENVVFGAPPKY